MIRRLVRPGQRAPSLVGQVWTSSAKPLWGQSTVLSPSSYSFLNVHHYSTDVNDVLDNVRAQEFLRELKTLKRQREVMSLPDFLQHYMQSTETEDSQAAERACAALSSAGLILRHGPLVYLHPEEIARSILQVLPQQSEVLKADLDQVRSEITDLQRHREQVERRVSWRRRAAQWAGLGMILLPWGILFRLTYWDLSWDVVEPIGFFLTGLTTILSYLWYMQHRKDFTWDEMHQRMISKWEERAYRQANFDVDRHEQLRKKADRLEQALRICQAKPETAPTAS